MNDNSKIFLVSFGAGSLVGYFFGHRIINFIFGVIVVLLLPFAMMYHALSVHEIDTVAVQNEVNYIENQMEPHGYSISGMRGFDQNYIEDQFERVYKNELGVGREGVEFIDMMHAATWVKAGISQEQAELMADIFLQLYRD